MFQADEIGIQTLETTFKVGQLVICSIVSVEKSDNDFFKVQASLNPELVNENLILSKNSLLTASVKSVEDHGYVMDIGKSNMKAFLPLKKSGKTPPSVGQVIPCSVTKVDGTAVVLNAAKLKPLSNVDNASVHTMHPGMIFDTTFENYIKNGVKLKIGKDFRGYVHDAHVGSEDFEPGTEVRAVVLYVLPTVNTICMSLLTDQLSFDKTSKSLDDRQVKIGSLVKNAVVIEANASLGLEVKLRGDDEEEEETEVGIVPIKHLNETQRKEIKTKFPPKTKVTVRVLQFDQFEQRFVCSMLKTMLEQNMIKADQLKPGDLVSAKAKKFVSKGLIVEVGRNVDGFLPHLHLSDIPLKNPEKKFSVGDKIKCRVLRSDPSKKKLHLTAKKILVDREDYVVVDDYNEKFANAITEGVVVKVSNEGVLLQLFGEATGWVPKSKISVEPVEYPEKLFFLGQVLKCQVVDVNTSKNKITLSLIIGGDSKMKPLGSKQKKAVESIKLGHVYEDVKICEVSQEGIAVEVSEQKLKAFIPVNHLTDHVSLADQLLNTYKPGDVISKAMCFEKDVVPILTLKPSVMNFQGKGMTFDELHEGQVIPGVVALVKEYGAFLKLPTIKFRKSALIPTRYLSDIFVDNPGDLVQVHQTLYGKIVEKSGNDDQNNRLTMSAKPRMVLEGENPAEKSMETLESFVQDIERIRQHHGNPDLLVHKVGDVVNCVVQDVNEFGIMTVLEGANQNQIRGLVPMASLEGLPQPSLGQTLAGVILFIDYQHSCVELSLNPEIVRKAATTKKTVKAGDILKASCVLRRSEHFMATMFCSKTGRFFHIPLRHHINDQIGFGDSLNMYKDQYSIVMKNEALSLAVLDNKRANQMLKRKRVNSLSDETTQIPEKVPKTVESPEAKKSKKKKKRQDSDKDEVPDVHEIKMETAAFPVEEDPGWSEDFNPFAMEMNQDAVASVKDEADTDVKPKKVKTHLSKKEKKELDKLEQAEIERAEQRVIDGEDAPPESVDEFDRLVLATPDSSLCWIQYIAFHLEKKNIEAARSVVKRALEKINFREETERFNVYMAWFNLENTFGTEEETEKVYKEAIQCNDEYKVRFLSLALCTFLSGLTVLFTLSRSTTKWPRFTCRAGRPRRQRRSTKSWRENSPKNWTFGRRSDSFTSKQTTLKKPDSLCSAAFKI